MIPKLEAGDGTNGSTSGTDRSDRGDGVASDAGDGSAEGDGNSDATATLALECLQPRNKAKAL